MKFTKQNFGEDGTWLRRVYTIHSLHPAGIYSTDFCASVLKFYPNSSFQEIDTFDVRLL